MLRSIKTKVVAYNLFIVLLVGVALGITGYSLMYKYFLQTSKAKLQLTSHHIAKIINYKILDDEALIKRAAIGREVEDYSINFRSLALAAYFSKFKEKIPVMSYLNEKGVEEVKTVNGSLSEDLKDYSKSSFFLEAKQNPNKVIIVPLGHSDELNESVIRLAFAKYRYFGDEFVGVILASIPLKDIVEEIASPESMNSAIGFGALVTLLIDKQGTIVFSPQREYLLKKIITGQGKKAEELIADVRAMHPGFSRAEIMGIDGYASYEPIDELKWNTLVILPYAEFIKQPNKMRNLSIGIFLIICVIGSSLVYYLALRTINPLLELSSAASLVAKGYFSEPLRIKSDDEVGRLVESFNKMIKDLKETTVSRDYMDSILASMKESLIVVSLEGKIQDVNAATCAMLGYKGKELIGKPVEIIFSGEPVNAAMLCDSLSHEESMIKMDKTYLTKDGKKIPVFFSASVISHTGGTRKSIICLAFDITERIEAEKRLMKLAYYDDLTGLPNRTLFSDRVKFIVHDAKRYGKTAAVLFLDLDNFKQINDSLGLGVGDMLLKEVANRLMHIARKSDTVARFNIDDTETTVSRFGGDEFAILLTEIKHAEDVGKIAQRILQAFQEPFLLNGHEAYITTSIGISIYPSDSASFGELIRYADMAMHEAKSMGKNNYRFFEPTLNIAAVRRLTMENNLRRGLSREEFVLYYQPQLDIHTGEIVGMEALIRWKSPDMGIVAPMEFIPIAEETGLIHPLGEWVLHNALLQVKAWRKAGLPPIKMSVNLSSLQFNQKALLRKLTRMTEEFEIDPQCLLLEITESVMIQKTEEAIDTLHKFNAMGFQFMMDDFGTGYSSLSYLKRIPLFAIKIDRSFLKGAVTNTDDAEIIRAIVNMVHSLKRKVVVEGVETEEQLSFLCKNGCDEVQGYLISRPLPAEKATKLLAEKEVETISGLLTCRKIIENCLGKPI